jgi:hypothetical protein
MIFDVNQIVFFIILDEYVSGIHSAVICCWFHIRSPNIVTRQVIPTYVRSQTACSTDDLVTEVTGCVIST